MQRASELRLKAMSLAELLDLPVSEFLDLYEEEVSGLATGDYSTIDRDVEKHHDDPIRAIHETKDATPANDLIAKYNAQLTDYQPREDDPDFSWGWVRLDAPHHAQRFFVEVRECEGGFTAEGFTGRWEDRPIGVD
ncbi:hypothetical protein LTR09_012408 [Extremus antarcticus]|uniref:Uncharacterized protein n=1 Tax=Extremus antarcticus TaxID=702011 RepID=A0AAJ0D596_9PEZI|nr:hypothetical protein LTR09_012408 [Extremus antarcticus]